LLPKQAVRDLDFSQETLLPQRAAGHGFRAERLAADPDHPYDGEPMHLPLILKLMILLTLANATPVIAKKIFNQRFAWPLDAGIKFLDGRPLLGPSKTVRGIALSVLVTAASAPLVGLGANIGAAVAATAMAGDLFSSFVKRRLALPPSTRATGLDQIPESLLPLLACCGALSLSAADIAAGVAIFFVGEVIFSRLLYRLRLRDRPY
jgi:CDP-archaeol synthase